MERIVREGIKKNFRKTGEIKRDKCFALKVMRGESARKNLGRESIGEGGPGEKICYRMTQKSSTRGVKRTAQKPKREIGIHQVIAALSRPQARKRRRLRAKERTGSSLTSKRTRPMRKREGCSTLVREKDLPGRGKKKRVREKRAKRPIQQRA